jgi:acyl dehydratase
VSPEQRDRPELLFDDLQPGREFRPLVFHISNGLVKRYMETVGDRHPLYWDPAAYRAEGLERPLAPPGIASIYARASYLQDHAMPSGGILAKQEFIFLAPAYVGDTLVVRARVAGRYVDEKGRKRVHFNIHAKREEGTVCEINLHAIWPR